VLPSQPPFCGIFFLGCGPFMKKLQFAGGLGIVRLLPAALSTSSSRLRIISQCTYGPQLAHCPLQGLSFLSWELTLLGEAGGLLTLSCSVSSESVIGNCMDRSSPGQAMEDHSGLGCPARLSVSEHHRPRTLQRHHTIQNSDDAYVCWSLLPVPA
jgi:hypothetical protein